MNLPLFLRPLSPLEEAQRAREQVQKQLLWQGLAVLEASSHLDLLRAKEAFLNEWLATQDPGKLLKP